jgi:translocation and assembly module TamB
MKRGVKVALWSGGTLVFVLVAVLAAISWVLFTTSGARWVAEMATSRFAPMVKYATLDGTIAGELVVTDFRFEGKPTDAKIRIARMTVDPTLRMLFSSVLRIERASVEGLVLTLPTEEKPDEPEKPLWVEPPLEIVVKDFALRDGRVVKGEENLVTVKQLGIAARWSREAIEIDRLELLPGDIEGEIDVKGRITPSGQTLRGVLDARWKKVVVPETLAGRVLHSDGELHIDGTPDKYAAKGEFNVGPPGDMTHAVLDVSGTDKRATLRTLELRQRVGRFALNGTVEFQPVSWNLTANAQDFNPGALLVEWPGKLNLALTTRGVLADAGPRGSVSIGRLDGVLRGRPIAGDGDIEFAAPDTLSGALQVRSGKSRIAVRGDSRGKQGVDATVELAVASLGDWVPDAAGSLTGNFRVRGEWPKLNIAGTANGKSLAFAENRVATLAVEATVESPLDPSGKLRATATKVSAAGFEFTQVSVNASGNQAKHEFAVDADGEKFDVAVALAGGLKGAEWRGRLTKLDVALPDVAKLALRAPSDIVVENGSFDITQTCLVDADSALCVAANVQQSGALEASYSFEKVPLALANAIAPDAMPGQLRGEVEGRGQIKRGADGQWLGDARISSPAARLVMVEEEGDAAATALGQRTWLIYENLDVQAELRGMNATATLTAALMNGGSLKATLGASNLTAEAPAIEGRIEASFPTLAPFGAFVPTIANLDGAVNADIRVGGTIKAPEVTGNVDAQRLQADLGEIGIELRDGRLQAEAKRGGGFVLAASVASGQGHLELAGTMSDRGVIDAKILGQNFQAADIPAVNVVLTPDLKLTGDPKLYLLRGEVTIPRAAINLQKLPQDQPPGVSPDVVVVRNGKEVERGKEAAGFPIDASILVKLGEQIEIQGFGLDATVAGQLTVRESPGVPTSGSGTLQVTGRYKAYGQDLTIKDGRLLFAGTPLDNPRLAIVAMREIDDNQSTGLRIVGSAQRPIITVISEPNVGEADALSYLVTGRSLNDVGSASGTSQDALASATRSLEGAGAGLVAKRIGQRLGLDEAGVEENEMIGGSALTIGEYLSPRLYLSYGIGLFEPGEVVALRYKLSDDIGVKVQRGSEETRAGIEYRIEK